MKKTNKTRRTVLLILAVAIIIIGGIVLYRGSIERLPAYINDANCAKIVSVYNNKVAGEKTEETKFNGDVEATIEQIVQDWSNGDKSYADAKKDLEDLCNLDNKKLSKEAKKQLKFITIEEKGNNLYESAEYYFEKEKYVKAFKCLSNINRSYSGYDEVKTFSKECEEILLALISSPTSAKEYEKYEKTVNKYIEIKETDAFLARKKELANEKKEFMAVAPALERANQLYVKRQFSASFKVLTECEKNNPGNKFIEEAIDEQHNMYVIFIAQEIKGKVRQELYKQAIDIIDEAIEVYDCEAFEVLRNYLMEKQYPILKYKNNIIGKIQSITNQWTQEEFDVHQAADSTGAYIVKSGEKMALGDYSEDEITILSVSGEVATSLLGVDLAIDVRDLSYDVTHWGEEDYFALRLAGDAVALVPVIGAVKYLKYSDEAASVAKKGAKSAKDVIGGTSDAAKATNKILDASTSVTKNAKQSEKVAVITLNHYKMIPDLKNQAEDVVKGIPMKMRHLDYCDGRKLVGKFPEFNSKYDIQLPKEKYKATRAATNVYCRKRLAQEIKTNPTVRNQFTSDQIKAIENNLTPKDFVWHHNEKEGLMQLVDKTEHQSAPHKGGYSLWGRGYEGDL